MVRNSGFGQIMEEGDSPGFFKILRREDLSSEIIRMIPHDIIRSIPDNSSSFKMILKVPWGSSWTIKISKNPNFHYMEDDGWIQFVNDNALGENEYLTFTHEANMRFNVNIYEPDGIEMLRPRESATIPSSSCMSKGREGVYKHVKEKIVSSSESSYHSLRKAQGKKQELNLGKKKAKESKISKRKKVDSDLEAGTSSLVPEFSITIKKSHLVFLGVPKAFMEMHMPKKTKWFKIRPEGKDSWDVLYLVTDLQSRFSAGWSRLSRELGLVVGDVCTFKLIKPSEMLVKVSRHDDIEEDDDDVEEDDDDDDEGEDDEDEDDDEDDDDDGDDESED